MDGCISLSTVHESIEVLAKLTFLSLRDCIILAGMPNSINTMTSLATLDLCGCLKLTTLPLRRTFSSSRMESLIFLDVSFCNLHKLPDAIGGLQHLERLSLQGNNFKSLPSFRDLRSLAYLNLTHCHKLQTFPNIGTLTGRSLVGSYFKMASRSCDHRSGLYIFDCPKVKLLIFESQQCFSEHISPWLQRFLKDPRHFRCGFDVIVPRQRKYPFFPPIPKWFHHQFGGRSIIRIVQFNVDDNWIGFSFCVAFEVNNCPTNSGSSHGSLSSVLLHPFYLSFESEHTEERFDMPFSLELDKIDGSKHLWIIYIS